MIKTFTQDDVIRDLYNETSEQEHAEIAKAMLCDAELEAMYKQLEEAKSLLELGFKDPSDSTVNAVINYSKKA